MPASTVDIRDVLAGLTKLERVSDSGARAFWTEARVDAKSELRSHRRELTRRDKDTVASHGAGRVLGKVLTAYRWIADASGLRGLSRVPYSLVLNEGGTVGNNAKLPAREYAYWSNPFQARIAERYAAFVSKRGWG